MRVLRKILTLSACLILCVLPSCDAAISDATPTPTPSYTPYLSEGENWLAKAAEWLTEVAWSATLVPIIGPLIAGVLGEVPAERHWIVGLVLVALVLQVLDALTNLGAAGSQRGE